MRAEISRTAYRGPARVMGIALFGLLFFCSGASALEVEEVRWNFDGRVLPEAINLVSVLVSSPADEAFDGTLSLQREMLTGSRTGPKLLQPCYVAPFTSRWVQFYPYVGSPNEDWVLTFGRRRYVLPNTNVGPPARVVLVDQSDPRNRPAGVRSFPENLFPPTVCATDALGGVVLDHAPRWEPVRRRAFMAWLRKGGVVHLVPPSERSRQEFEGELSALNLASDRFEVGDGLVVRHPVSLSEVTDDYLSSKGFPKARLESDGAGMLHGFDGLMLTYLRGLVRPEHEWVLIYALLVAYGLVAGPVNYIVARKSRSFLRPILLFACTVGVSVFMMTSLGKRGYGEVATVHSFSYARQIEPGTYDVCQWADAFATRGARYDIRHGGGYGIYSACQLAEPVPGFVVNGPAAVFSSEVPPYSSRSYLHRSEMGGPRLSVAVGSMGVDGQPQSMKLTSDETMPGPPETLWTVSSGVVATYRWDDQEGEFRRRDSRREDFYFQQANLGRLRGWGYGYGERVDDEPFSEQCRDLAVAVMARALGTEGMIAQRVENRYESPGRIHVFILVRSPEGFRMKPNPFGGETGYTLFHILARDTGGEHERD